jgi:hypothetical protein
VGGGIALLLNQAHQIRTLEHLGPTGETIFIFASVLGSVFLITYAQQLILARGGLPTPSWVLRCFAGVCAAACSFLLLSLLGSASILMAWLTPGTGLMLLAGIIFAGTGTTYGVVQTVFLNRTFTQHAAWIIASAVAPLLMILSVALFEQWNFKGESLFGTVAGAIYGVVTGTCLLLLLPQTGK